jgi:competence protein ComEC
LHGDVWASSAYRIQVKRSDVIRLYGKLKPGFGSFAASMSYADVQSISHADKKDFGLKIRDWFAADIRRIIPEPQASLGIGYLLGQRSALPQDLDTDFKIVGLTHAVVASGYNLTILVAFAIRRLNKTSKYLTALSAALLSGSFLCVAGFSPSMTRAGLVTGLSLVAWYYGRTIHPLVILPFAAAITVLMKPEYAWGDIGWALSFAAFAGVLVIAPLLHRCFWGDKKPGAMREIFIGTMSAQLATLPIMVFAFGQYSPYALIANVLVLPLVPVIMMLTFLSGIFGLFLPVGFAHIFAWPDILMLRYSTATVQYIANLPGAAATTSLTAPKFAGAYVIVFALTYILWRKTHYNFRLENIVE